MRPKAIPAHYKSCLGPSRGPKFDRDFQRVCKVKTLTKHGGLGSQDCLERSRFSMVTSIGSL